MCETMCLNFGAVDLLTPKTAQMMTLPPSVYAKF